MYKIINKYTKEEYIYLSGTITDRVNQASSIQFTTSIDTEIEELTTFIEVFHKDKKVFSGRVITVNIQMNNEGIFIKVVKAESVINYLSNKFITNWDVRPNKANVENDKLLNGYTLIEYATVDTILDKILTLYNSISVSSRKIKKGTVTVAGGLDFTVSSASCLNVLLNNIVAQKGGYVSVEEIDDVYYLNCLKIPKVVRGENIELAVNQKDISVENTLVNMCTRVYPIGSDSLKIGSINGNKDYIEDSDLVEKYGVIEYVLDCSGVTDKSELKSKAEEYLQNIKNKKYSVTINVADLSYINNSSKTFELYQICRIKNDIMNIDEDMVIIEITRNLLEPHLPRMIFNNSVFKQSRYYAEENNKLNATIGKVDRTTNNVTYNTEEVDNINSKFENQKKYMIMGV